MASTVRHYPAAPPSVSKKLPNRSWRGLDWCVFFVADVQTGFGAFVSVFLTDQKWTQADIGLLLTVSGLVSLFGQAPCGALVDAAALEARVGGFFAGGDRGQRLYLRRLSDLRRCARVSSGARHRQLHPRFVAGRAQPWTGGRTRSRASARPQCGFCLSRDRNRRGAHGRLGLLGLGSRRILPRRRAHHPRHRRVVLYPRRRHRPSLVSTGTAPGLALNSRAFSPCFANAA